MVKSPPVDLLLVNPGPVLLVTMRTILGARDEKLVNKVPLFIEK